MQKEIIAAIAAYLEPRYGTISSRLLQATNEQQVSEILNTVSTEIATAIAPLVAEKDLPLLELFTHMSEQHDLTLTDTELADIIQISRSK